MSTNLFHPSFEKSTSFDLVHEVAETHPDSLAIVFPGGQLNYRQFSDSVVYLGEELRAKGIRRGSLVAVDLPPHLDFLALLAINLIGAVSCSVSGMPAVPETLSPDWLITGPESQLALAPKNTIRVDGGVLLTKAPKTNWRELRRESVFPGTSVARLVFTSGTTGQPKAVVFSAALVEKTVKKVAENCTSQQSSFSLIYFSRIGLSTALMQMSRALPVGFSNPNPRNCFDVALRLGATDIIGSPIQIFELVTFVKSNGYSLPSLTRFCITGGLAGKELISLINSLSEGIAIEIWYGSNETGRVSSLVVTEDYEAGNVGQLLPSVEVEISNEHGNPAEDGQVGLIRVRTDQMAREYFNDVNQTARSFVGDWFVSGDLGLIDLDDNLVLLGRSTDLVNAGGLKINPVFVETKLRTLEGVRDCAGVEVSSVKGITEFAVAVVGQEQLDLVRLSNLLKSYFPRTHPTVYAQIEAIPRNQNGKVDRSKLRSWFEQKRI